MYLCIQANVNPKYFFNKATKIINPQANMARCPSHSTKFVPRFNFQYVKELIYLQTLNSWHKIRNDRLGTHAGLN